MNIKTTFLFTVILTVAQVLASTPVSNDVEIPLLDGTTTWAPEPVSEIRSLDRSGHYFRAVLHSTTSEMNEFSKDLRIAYYSAAVVNVILFLHNMLLILLLVLQFLLALSLMCTVAVKSTVGTSTFWAFLTFATMANAFGLQVTRNHKNQQLALPVIALGMLEVVKITFIYSMEPDSLL